MVYCRDIMIKDKYLTRQFSLMTFETQILKENIDKRIKCFAKKL
jgi:hypothetical protein